MPRKRKNKRELLEGLITLEAKWNYIPASFFTHFSKECHTGRAAINKHIDFFRYTDMDFVKIQFEQSFPKLDFIRRPKDWTAMPRYNSEFFREPIEIVKGLIKELKKEAIIIQTIYSPYMCAANSTSYELITKHVSEKPDLVMKGLAIIRDSLQCFIDDCVKEGIDGFYFSTQGGEHQRFENKNDFEGYIQPFDLSLLMEIDSKTPFNILHICDYWLLYDSVDIFTKYPCKIVSCPIALNNGQQVHANELYKIFMKPILGGMNRKGAIQTGPIKEIEKDVNKVLARAPDRFILGANCTIANANWDYLRSAVFLAHDYRRA